MTLQYLRRTVDPVNQYRRWIDPRVRTLAMPAVITYLRQHDWRELPPDRPGLLAFQEPTGSVVNGKPLCQFVPDSEEYDDYPQRMFELLTGLAEFEERQASEIIDDILRSPGSANGEGARRDQPGNSDVASASAKQTMP
jgi:hypothetical protein